MMSYGHRYTLVCASLAKRALQSEMPPGMRLSFLNYLERMVDQYVTSEVIAIIEPMDDQGFELSREAQKLGHGRPGALDVYADKFDVFAALNPSLRRAYDAAFGRYDAAVGLKPRPATK